MSCSHPAAAITDHAVHSADGNHIRYAWRGACGECHRGIVGLSAVPAGTSAERLAALLTGELHAYLRTVAAAPA